MTIRLYLTARDPLVLWSWLCGKCGARRGSDWWASGQLAPIEGDCDDCGAIGEVSEAIEAKGRT